MASFSFPLFVLGLCSSAFSNTVDPPVFNFDYHALDVSVDDLETGRDYHMNISMDFTNQRSRTHTSGGYPPATYQGHLLRCKSPAPDGAYAMDFDGTTCNVDCWNGTSPSQALASCTCSVANIFADLATAKLNPNPCTSEGVKAQMWDNVMYRYCIGKDSAGQPKVLFVMQYKGTGLQSISNFQNITFGTPPASDFATPSYCKAPPSNQKTHNDDDEALLGRRSRADITWPERA